jgi:hypothetical protein
MVLQKQQQQKQTMAMHNKTTYTLSDSALIASSALRDSIDARLDCLEALSMLR